jgi:LmbE family N-acetylglucosaminyl deacetylase
MKTSRKVIVISAHPDDETLGVGGSLLKHKSNGDELYWIIVTCVSTEHGFTNDRVESRKREIESVTEAFGFQKVFQMGYPTMSLSSSSLKTLIPEISKIFTEVEPEIIYTLNRSDAHSDHRFLFDAVAACTKSFRYPYIKQVLMYECISETEFAPSLPERVFIPNYFIDVTGFLEEKIRILQIFDSELGDHPFPRSIKNVEALSVYRGASVGVEHAEAFQIIKFIDK